MPSAAICAIEHHGGIQMRERRRRRRIGQIVRRHVHRLDRGDRAGLGRGDALLQHAHLLGERRLIAHRRGHAAQQRRDLGARERVAIDIVDEEQDVAAAAVGLLLVAEILGHRQPGERDAQAVARRLVHLAVDHRDLGVGEVIEVDDLGLDHLVIEVVALARALADARKHRQARILLGDVVDELEHVDGLADAGAAEQPHLAALGERHQQIDDLDAGDQQFLSAGLLLEASARAMDRPALACVLTSPRLSCGCAEHVHDAPERALADRHRDRRAGVGRPARPRCSPSVMPMAMVRTTPSPSSCCTSSVRSRSTSLSAS